MTNRRKITDINSKAINPSISKALAVGINRFTNKDLNRSTSKKYDSLAKIKDGKSLFTKAVKNYTPKKKKDGGFEVDPFDVASASTDYFEKRAEDSMYPAMPASDAVGWKGLMKVSKIGGKSIFIVSTAITYMDDVKTILIRWLLWSTLLLL